MTDDANVLAVQALEPTEDGHAYVFSYSPSGALGPALSKALTEEEATWAEHLQPPARGSYVPDEDRFHIRGLTAANREAVEDALATALTKANIAAAGITNEERTAEIVVESINRLPVDLP